MTYGGYMVNGCSYHTKSRDDHRTVQNSGIMLVATTMQVSSAKDKNPAIGDMSFYGIIEDIWEVSYNTFNTVLFKCKWVENKNGVRIDDLHFTLVNLSRIGHSSDSFIIATHGQQVFYVSDPVDPRWSVVSQNGIQQLTLMKVGMHTLDLTVKAHGLPLGFHTTKAVGDTNRTISIVDMVDSQDAARPKEKGESSTQKRKRGPTEMKEITRARSEGQKLVIQYNELGQAIGQNATKLKSFIGTTVRFHVPIIYSDWPTVPKEIKDKIFELIEAGFVVDPRSKKTIIQNVGVCFRQFKYRLTTTYVLPFLDDVEKLKFPPNEYSFIDQQHWTEFVASRLKEDFKKKSENGKEKWKKHKYNHRTFRKGYANLMEELKASSSDQIDRSIVWKQARMDRKGQIPDQETKEVVNLIDELVATQNTTNAFGEEDILTRALGGKDRLGILRGVGKYVTKKKIRKRHRDVVELNEDIKVDIAKDDKKVEGVTLEKMKVGTPCKLAFETKDHVVAWGTIIDSDAEGDNVKVAVDVVVDGDCAIPIPSEQGMYKMSQEVGSHILWPRDLVITNNIKMDYGEFTKDMSTFAPTPIQNAPVALRFLLRMVEHMGSAIQITTPHDVFGVRRKCCIMIESLKDFTSMRPIATACLDAYIMYLYTRMESSRTLNLYKFVDAGNHWTLVVINLTKGPTFWIDPLKNRIDPDVTEVGERLFNIMNKKKPAWRVVKCPKQSGVVECGYYVMRFMRDIIMSTSTSIIQIVDKGLNKAKGNPMAFYKVLPQSIGAMKPWIRQLVDV
ncbi:hypothetical protein E6C27_scaffold386G00370 [Cucumis melo var. makuwa]|uniref:Ubiquitin-like protease family profile domain-containing protein n=1 Tax=Cucumis melo var. makuwa TaxID=1194695 RepID=A0A5A7V2W4_CUCMM|nr:hypothetical protein E6C27_scaffold386G00370 [Cucumis melo var. makuwa]